MGGLLDWTVAAQQGGVLNTSCRLHFRQPDLQISNGHEVDFDTANCGIQVAALKKQAICQAQTGMGTVSAWSADKIHGWHKDTI